MIAPELLDLYRQARAPHYSMYGAQLLGRSTARVAINQARQMMRANKQQATWDDLDGFTICQNDRHEDSEPGASIDCPGPVRLLIIPDHYCDLDDLLGDSFNPSCCPEIPPAVLAREREVYIAKIDQEGVWGVVGQYWHEGDWQDADSCFGFVGDDWRGSGYDYDIMGAALAAHGAAQERDARDLEATRPDMYGRTAL